MNHQSQEPPSGNSAENIPDGEIAPAPDAAAEQPPVAPEELGRLREEAARFKDLALRNQADLENFRKRMAREKEELARYATSALLEKLLPVLDSFELGLAHARSTPGAESIAQGFVMVEKQLADFLREAHVEVIDATGSEFDPNLHEAVSHLPDPEIPAGGISKQIRKGYKLRDRLLRPATVVVSSGRPPGEGQS